jgi:hypothetical protein
LNLFEILLLIAGTAETEFLVILVVTQFVAVTSGHGLA